MDSQELAQRLNQLRLKIDEREPQAGKITDTSIPGLVLQIDPSKVTAFPSSNPNSIQISGDGSDVNESSICAAISKFEAHRVERFFFWIDPLTHAEKAFLMMKRCGFSPFTGTKYPVLWREAIRVESPNTDLIIRKLSPDEGREISSGFRDESARKRFKETLGVAGFDHFAAFHGSHAVATARLFNDNSMSYLCDAWTMEDFRNRGAQSALIAARINRAAELGCSLCVVQTLTFLTGSLKNLVRLGFRRSYDRKVYQFSFPGGLLT